jgi:hypothetical protein
MKQIFLFFAVCLLMAACDNDAEFAARDTQAELLQPEGIEVAGLQSVSISYAADGDYMPAIGCTDQGDATNSLATRGDLCVRMIITNTTQQPQVVNRRDFALDFDGRAYRTPTTLYNQQMRAVKYIEVAPESDTTVTLYYSGLMPATYPQWAQMPADINALYSIDIRLGIAATYLVGFDLYTTTGPDCWMNR